MKWLFCGQSTVSKRLAALSGAAAGNLLPVLIEGEKGLRHASIARCIHDSGGHAAGDFIHLDFAGRRAIDSEDFARLMQRPDCTVLLTGATSIPIAYHDTLLALLRRQHEPPSGSGPRLIAAAASDLADEVRKKRMSHELYIRLAVQPIRLPPLRERIEDLEDIAEAFLVARYASTANRGLASRLNTDTVKLLKAHDWPGNFEELETVLVQSAEAAGGNAILPHHLPASLQPQARGFLTGNFSLRLASQLETQAQDFTPSRNAHNLHIAALTPAGQIRPLVEVEAELIRIAITRCKGQMSEIARQLGIGRSTLYRKMRELRLQTKTA